MVESRALFFVVAFLQCTSVVVVLAQQQSDDTMMYSGSLYLEWTVDDDTPMLLRSLEAIVSTAAQSEQQSTTPPPTSTAVPATLAPPSVTNSSSNVSSTAPNSSTTTSNRQQQRGTRVFEAVATTPTSPLNITVLDLPTPHFPLITFQVTQSYPPYQVEAAEHRRLVSGRIRLADTRYVTVKSLRLDPPSLLVQLRPDEEQKKITTALVVLVAVFAVTTLVFLFLLLGFLTAQKQKEKESILNGSGDGGTPSTTTRTPTTTGRSRRGSQVDSSHNKQLPRNLSPLPLLGADSDEASSSSSSLSLAALTDRFGITTATKQQLVDAAIDSTDALGRVHSLNALMNEIDADDDQRLALEILWLTARASANQEQLRREDAEEENP